MNLNARIERLEPRLGNRWDLRGVLHLEKNQGRALPVVVCEINGLWFQIRKNRLNRAAESSGLGGRISGLDRNIRFKKKSHEVTSDERLIYFLPQRARKMVRDIASDANEATGIMQLVRSDQQLKMIQVGSGFLALQIALNRVIPITRGVGVRTSFVDGFRSICCFPFWQDTARIM